MTEKVDVAVIGAGQAGLATSWYLTQAGIDHAVLESGRLAETWRSRRWDSFCLVTPNWSVRLPGAPYDGPDPDGFMDRGELVGHFERWAAGFDPPVRGGCAVSALDGEEGAFTLQTAAGPMGANSVVVATGGYQRPHLPPAARDFPPHVTQLLGEDYRNSELVPEGAVLIVGSGQTGCQLAEELHEAGRRVVLSCGRAPWAPRTLGGRDLVWWIIETGWWERTLADLPSPAGRLLSNPLATGHGGGHDLHLRTLHEKGVELAGRYLGASDGTVHLDPDLDALIAAGDAFAGVFKKWVDALCARRELAIPWELPPALHLKSRTDLDMVGEGINTVIWTTGFRPDYGWVHLPVFDDMGFPIQSDGRSAVPGLYFMGVHFQRKGQSAVLYGVGEDAELVVRHIAEQRP